MNMYVGNLNYRVKEGDLEQAMAVYGVVTSVKVIKDRETGKSKGFAFVEMESDAEAAQAMNELNGSEFMGRQLVIKEARKKSSEQIQSFFLYPTSPVLYIFSLPVLFRQLKILTAKHKISA